MLLLLQIAASTLVGLAAVVCIYHIVLAVVGLVGRRRRRVDRGDASHTFAIVIPAHNEEGTIERALQSCASIDYPRESYTVFVVVDNCSDDTADIALRNGARCLIRRDGERRGKGFALEWAIPQVLAAGCDAILVLDADCQIDAQALAVFSDYLGRGYQVLQAADAVANPEDSATSYILAVANTLENELFYAPKAILGLSVLLRGTGMVLHRRVLEKHPWRAASIVEDAEYTTGLLEAGIAVRFVSEVRVVSAFPSGARELRTQRARWIHGGVRLSKTVGVRLMAQGLFRGRPRLLDAGWTLMIVSRPFVIAGLLGASLAAAGCWHWTSGVFSRLLVLSVGAILLFYALYCLAGILLLGLNRRRLVLTLRMPLAIVQYLWLACSLLAHAAPTSWQRTPRPRENS